MPSPQDFAITPWNREFDEGPCGFASGRDDPGTYSLQEAYERAGRCDEYGETFDRDGQKIVWTNYRYDTPKPHSFQGFFAHYGLDWWDGYVPARIKGTELDAAVVGWAPGAVWHGPTSTGGGSVASASDATRTCGGAAPDALSGSLQRFLSANDMCHIYSEDQYASFKDEVDAELHYAVNYVAWMAKAPLLSAQEARAADAQYLSALEPSAPRSAASSGRSATERSSAVTGDCGFPVNIPEQASGQKVLATMGRCDEYTGPRS